MSSRMPTTHNTVVDANTQTVRCEKYGDEIPIPLGIIPWVTAVLEAFVDAYSVEEPHQPGRTLFSIPTR